MTKIDKAEFLQRATQFAHPRSIADNDALAKRYGAVRTGSLDGNGMFEDVILGFDPKVDAMVAEARAAFVRAYQTKAAIGRYLRDRLEKK